MFNVGLKDGVPLIGPTRPYPRSVKFAAFQEWYPMFDIVRGILHPYPIFQRHTCEM